MPSIHAEHDGMLNLIKLNKYKRFLKSHDMIDVVVIRISKCGKLGYSRPCKICIQRMMKFNNKIRINNVYYSDSDGTFKMEKLSSMYESPLTKLSAGDKRRQRTLNKTTGSNNKVINVI
jgi:cytidine deaminase